MSNEVELPEGEPPMTYVILCHYPEAPEELTAQSGRALTDWIDARIRDDLSKIKSEIETAVAPHHFILFQDDLKYDYALYVYAQSAGAEAIRQIPGVRSVYLPGQFRLSSPSPSDGPKPPEA